MNDEKIPVKERLRAYISVSTIFFIGSLGGFIIGRDLAKGYVPYVMILVMISIVGIAIIMSEIEYRRKVKKIDP